jgi:hypothetical protein
MTTVSEGENKKAMWVRRIASFALCNGLVFIVFSVLWVKEYHMSNSDEIDHIVVPWLWLVCFFTASLCTLRSRVLPLVLISVASAVVFAGVLFVFIHIVLVPMFDPMF